jgi:ferrous iron transport protein A
MRTLNLLNINEIAIIKEVKPSLFRRRLLELGILPNTLIKVTHKTLFNGPISIKIRGYSLALRLSEAKTVVVESII